MAIEGLRIARRVMAAPAFKPFIAKERMPGEGAQTDEELDAYVRQWAKTDYHPVGTCKMGTDELAVVSPRLAVRGVEAAARHQLFGDALGDKRQHQRPDDHDCREGSRYHPRGRRDGRGALVRAGGMTRKVYVIVGDPVGQVRSPAVFNALYAERGVDAVMVPFEVPAGQLEAVLGSLRSVRNLGGIVATIPHKLEAAAIAVRRSERVRLAGAANVLKPVPDGWEADLFDGVGFLTGLAKRGIAAAGRRIAIVGAGGAGLAIAEALLSGGAAAITIFDRDRAKAGSAVAQLGRTWPGKIEERAPDASADIVVNATPCGMRPGDPLPVDLDRIAPSAFVADAIMKPPLTALLIEAARRKHPTMEGRHMLDGQVESIWEFLGMSADRGEAAVASHHSPF